MGTLFKQRAADYGEATPYEITMDMDPELEKETLKTEEEYATYEDTDLKKKMDKILDALKEDEGSGKVPTVKPLLGREPSLLPVATPGPSYRGTQSPYTYGQIPTSLRTPAQLQAEAEKGIEQFLNMAVVAAPRMRFRGLI